MDGSRSLFLRSSGRERTKGFATRVRQWNHETRRKEEKEDEEDIEKNTIVSLPLRPSTGKGTGRETSGLPSDIDINETQETLLENGLRGEQISK